MTTETPAVREAFGPRFQGEVRVSPETEVSIYDFGSGCHIRIGDFFGSHLVIQLGWDDETRRDACDRLIAALTAARDWLPK